MPTTRRTFLTILPAALAPVVLTRVDLRQGQSAPIPTSGASFPSHPPDMAREMVGVAHNNVARVKELLAARPTLARAAWDWGFGDWEDALGAASHVGNREIAEVLLKSGARPTIFSAAMLGQIDAVRAFIAASPGIESTPGPHGITLLRHALAGGAAAQAVADYLKTLPGADARPAVQPISPEELAEILGNYVYGSGADERIVIATSNNIVTFTRAGRSGRNLMHVGGGTFFPVGAPLVRITFQPAPSGMMLKVYDPDVVLEARRTS